MLHTLVRQPCYTPLSVGIAGEQRLRNVEKLIDIVDDFESQAGGTLRDVVVLLRSQALLDRDEGDAELPDDGAVQLLTVHRAKGLEWPVVIVPDTHVQLDRSVEETQGRRGGSDHTRLAVGRQRVNGEASPQVAMSYRRADRSTYKTLLWRRIERDTTARGRAEMRRLLYVAFTRAKEHLILLTQGVHTDTGVALDDGKTWGDWIHAILIDGDVTRGSVPFYERMAVAPMERIVNPVDAPEEISDEVDLSRVWRSVDAPVGAEGTGP